MKRIKPTLEWLITEYSRLDEKLFDGELGHCDFMICDFGSKKSGNIGDTLGCFMSKENVYMSKRTRKMYVLKIVDGKIQKEWLTLENFRRLFKPIIAINSNYSAPEKAWRLILIHEMCHYKATMSGIWPWRHHGKEFMDVVDQVYKKSKGHLKIDIMVKTDDLDFKLDKNIKKTRQQITDKKKAKLMAIFVVRDSNKIELTTTSSSELLDKIIKIHTSTRSKALKKGDLRGVCSELIVSTDNKVIDKLYERGYRTDFKKYKCWVLPDNLKNLCRKKQNKIILEKFELNNKKTGYMKLLSCITDKK